jgi:putative peptidoglycan lipid II flippase
VDQKELPGNQKSEQNVLKSAGAMGAATFLSRITGLLREQIFATFFGAGNFTDAFYIAFRIPNLLRDLFAEGALSAAFIPTFTRVRAERGEADAWRLAGLVFRLLFGVGVVLAIVGIFFSPELVTLYAPDFKNFTGKFEITVLMTRILFPFFPLVALAAAYMGILNACGKFFLPAFASALFNIFSVMTGLFFAWLAPKYGYEAITGMALGVVFGGAAQAFSQLPVLYQSGYRWKKRVAVGPSAQPVFWKEPALREMCVLMGPNVLINSILATGLGPGAVTWLSYAFRLMQFPIGIFGVSLAAATLPRISRLMVAKPGELPLFAQTEDSEKSEISHERAIQLSVQKSLTESLNSVLAINLPASAGMIAIGVPIIELLFQYGKFQAEDTWNTAQVLGGYAVGLTAYSLVKVLVPICYVTKRTRAAVVSSLISVLMSFFVGAALSQRLGAPGLALSTSLSALFNAGYLFWVLRPWVDFPAFFKALSRQIVVAGTMGAIVFWTLPGVQGLLSGLLHFRVFSRISVVFVEMAMGAILVIVLGKVLRAPETTQIVALFSSKILRKIKKKLSP